VVDGGEPGVDSRDEGKHTVTESIPRFRCTVALNPAFSVAPSNLLAVGKESVPKIIIIDTRKFPAQTAVSFLEISNR